MAERPVPNLKLWHYHDGCIKANDLDQPEDYANCQTHYKCRQLVCETISKERAEVILAAIQKVIKLERELDQEKRASTRRIRQLLEENEKVDAARREGARKALEWCGCAELATHVNNLDEAIDAALGGEKKI